MAALDKFLFPFHLIQDEYQAGATVRFGKGYTFASKPNGPEEIIFHLTFHNGMFFLEDRDPLTGKFTRNDIADPTYNIMALLSFYASKLMYGVFIYPHPYLGEKTVRFNKPLLMPKVNTADPGAVGGLNGRRAHQTEAFDLELILIP